MTIGATLPITGSASIPNEIASRNAAIAYGTPIRAPDFTGVLAQLCSEQQVIAV